MEFSNSCNICNAQNIENQERIFDLVEDFRVTKSKANKPSDSIQGFFSIFINLNDKKSIFMIFFRNRRRVY